MSWAPLAFILMIIRLNSSARPQGMQAGGFPREPSLLSVVSPLQRDPDGHRALLGTCPGAPGHIRSLHGGSIPGARSGSASAAGDGLCPDMSHNLLGESCVPCAAFLLPSATKGVLVEGEECHVLEHLGKSLVLPSWPGEFSLSSGAGAAVNANSQNKWGERGHPGTL